MIAYWEFSKHIARMLFLYVLITPGYFQCILNFVSVILSFFSIMSNNICKVLKVLDKGEIQSSKYFTTGLEVNLFIANCAHKYILKLKW